MCFIWVVVVATEATHFWAPSRNLSCSLSSCLNHFFDKWKAWFLCVSITGTQHGLACCPSNLFSSLFYESSSDGILTASAPFPKKLRFKLHGLKEKGSINDRNIGLSIPNLHGILRSYFVYHLSKGNNACSCLHARNSCIPGSLPLMFWIRLWFGPLKCPRTTYDDENSFSRMVIHPCTKSLYLKCMVLKRSPDKWPLYWTFHSQWKFGFWIFT